MAWAAPASLGGRLAATLGLALAVVGLALATQNSRSPGETIAAALVLSSPTFAIAGRGHFGWRGWRLPSAGGFVYLFWQLGLGPSMCAVSDRALRFCRFGDAAVLYAQAVHLAWFWLFALALGPSPVDEEPEPRRARPGAALELVLLAAVWLAAMLWAARLHALSFWRPQPRDGRAGLELAGMFVYIALTPLLPAVALGLARHPRRAVRALAAGLFMAGAAFLFVLSSRRLWVVGGFLCLLVLQLQRGKPPRRELLAAALVTPLVLGPVLWSYRTLSTRRGPQDHLALAYRAVADVLSDGRERERSWAMSSENLGARLDVGGVTFGVAQYALDHGPRLGGTMLSGLVSFVPSFAWPGKNAVAHALDAREQILKSGRFPDVDMPLSPIAELIYDLGPLAPLCGLLYGACAGWATRRSRAALGRPHRALAWAALVQVLSFFDAGASFLLVGMREQLLVAGSLWLASALAAAAARPIMPSGWTLTPSSKRSPRARWFARHRSSARSP